MIGGLLRVTVLIFCVGLSGCIVIPTQVGAELEDGRPGESNNYAVNSQTATPVSIPTKRSASGTVAPDVRSLVSGQILVRDDGDAISLFVSLFAEEFLPWSHIGVISQEADGTYVYDANGELFPVPGVPPSATFVGSIQRTPFAQYVASGKIFGIYAPPPGADGEKIAAFVRDHYARKTPFDAYFDNTDAAALYCSELVAHAIRAAGAVPIRQAPARVNRSYDVLRDWLRVKATGFYLPAHFADPTRKIALWSTDFSPVQIEAQFEARRELARRFTATTRLGHLFNWSIQGLALREAPQRFQDAITAAFASGFSPGANSASISQEVRRLADLHFSGAPVSGTVLAPVR